jgi:hypothetical protein
MLIAYSESDDHVVQCPWHGLNLILACTPSIEVVLKKASQGSNNKKKVCGGFWSWQSFG